MAKCVDNYSDLEELGIDCDENDSLTQAFNRAANHLQNLYPNVNSQTLLVLYGYYKQGSEGTCKTPKPRWYDVKAKAKWDSWSKLGDMSPAEAKMLYIKAIKELDPSFKTSASPTEQWVRVSSMQEEVVAESEKTFVDYIKEGKIEDVKDYLERNVDCKASLNRTCNGLAAIHWAADSGFTEIIDVLIKAGADVNLQDAEGQTPLHYASSCGHIECVKYLLQNGGRDDIVDGENNTPSSVASDDSVKELFTHYCN